MASFYIYSLIVLGMKISLFIFNWVKKLVAVFIGYVWLTASHDMLVIWCLTASLTNSLSYLIFFAATWPFFERNVHIYLNNFYWLHLSHLAWHVESDSAIFPCFLIFLNNKNCVYIHALKLQPIKAMLYFRSISGTHKSGITSYQLSYQKSLFTPTLSIKTFCTDLTVHIVIFYSWNDHSVDSCAANIFLF